MLAREGVPQPLAQAPAPAIAAKAVLPTKPVEPKSVEAMTPTAPVEAIAQRTATGFQASVTGETANFHFYVQLGKAPKQAEGSVFYADSFGDGWSVEMIQWDGDEPKRRSVTGDL